MANQKPTPATAKPALKKLTKSQIEAMETPPIKTETNPPMENPERASQNSSVDANHINEIDTGEEPLEGEIDQGETPDADDDKSLTKDAFYVMFKTAFAVPNALLTVRGIAPLESLPIAPGEEQSARDACDTLYEIIEETDALKWMLSEDTKWLARCSPIALFFSMKFSLVSAELKGRRKGALKSAEVAQLVPETAGVQVSKDTPEEGPTYPKVVTLNAA